MTLAESVGSIASNFLNTTKNTAFVGLEISANHITPGRVGDVAVATAIPIHIGKSTHVWNIEIRSKKDNGLICVSRFTTHILKLDRAKYKDSHLQDSQKTGAPAVAKL